MPEERKVKSRLIFPITFTSVLTLFFLFVAAMTTAYLWGVMAGRHYAQEARLPAVVAAEPELGQDSVQMPEDGKILKPQELEFANVLRGEKPKPHIQEKPKEGQAQEQPGAQRAKPEESSAEEAPGSVSPAAKTDDSSANADVNMKTAQDDGQIYDYVYQLAAFRDEQSADNLRERLEGHGLRTRLERRGKAFIVLAVLRGSAVRAGEIKEIAKQLRLGEPLLRSKRMAGQR